MFTDITFELGVPLADNKTVGPTSVFNISYNILNHNFRHEVERLTFSSVSSNTLEVYRRGLNSFIEFRKEFGLKPNWPVLIEDLSFYIAYMFKEDLSYSTARSYLTGVGFLSKLNNFEDVTRRFVLTKMMEGFKRIKPRGDIRLPITRDLLGRILWILPSICASTYESNLFQAVFSVAFHGFF